MKKYRILFLLVLCLFLQLSSTAETLKGGIEKVWNIDSAREEAFKDLKPMLDLSWVPPIDPNLIENKQAMNNQQGKVKNRVITEFSNGYYGVQVFDDDNYDKAYYYSPSGGLAIIDFTIYPIYVRNVQDFINADAEGKTFPYKVYKHSFPDGKIKNVALIIGDNETYIFKPSGELEGHWVGNTCYDFNGNKTLSRYRPAE